MLQVRPRLAEPDSGAVSFRRFFRSLSFHSLSLSLSLSLSFSLSLRLTVLLPISAGAPSPLPLTRCSTCSCATTRTTVSYTCRRTATGRTLPTNKPIHTGRYRLTHATILRTHALTLRSFRVPSPPGCRAPSNGQKTCLVSRRVRQARRFSKTCLVTRSNFSALSSRSASATILEHESKYSPAHLPPP